MARPREFDADKAINDAMNVFWESGYDGASLPDLLSGMGITRGSLYKAFTDKRRLFLTCLTRYEQDVVTKAVELLNTPAIEDGYDRIDRFLRSVTQDVCCGDTRGCLICTTAAEAAAEDHEISTIIRRLLQDLQSGIAAALIAAKPDIPPQKRDEIANLLLNTYIGLRIRARAQIPADELEKSISALMRLLRNQTPETPEPQRETHR